MALFNSKQLVSFSTIYQYVVNICNSTPTSNAVELYDGLKSFLNARADEGFNVKS
jgi:hypothetical protein